MTTILAFIFWIAAYQGTPATAGPQAPRQQARAVVAGATVRSDVSDSLGFVSVKLVPLDDPGIPALAGRGGANPSAGYQVLSDAFGQFQFSNVIHGRYAISAEREGYVPEARFTPGPRQSIQSILTISAGMKMDGLIVTMTPVPTISGRVYSPLGQPLAGVTVQAYRVQFTPYGRQLVRVASVLSHEGGEYRLFRLTPGYYYVSASSSDRSLRAWKALLKLSPNLSNPDDGYSTVYYPGEMKVASAKVINLYNGGVANADIGFKETRYFKLSIRLLLPAPQPPNIPSLRNPKVALLPAGADLGAAQDFAIQGSGTNFSVEHLAEGDYVLVALAESVDLNGNSYYGIASDTVPVRVTENTQVTIAAMDPFDIPGTVGPAGGSNTAAMQIQLVRVDPFANQTISASVGSTGQFTLMGVGPGTYDVVVQGMPRNAYLAQAGFPNADRRLLQVRVDSSLPLRSWRCEGDCRTSRLISNATLTATVSTAGSTVSGSVVDGRGASGAGAQIVMVPIDATARLRKDRYGVTYADTSGVFQISGIIPGNYMAYAFEGIEPDIYLDPDFNAQISRQGTPVIVGSGFTSPLERRLSLITKDDVARLTR